MIFETLFVQAMVFSAVSVGGIVLLCWWLYFSPMQKDRAATSAPAHIGRRLALLIGLGAVLISIGGYWDISKHVVTGVVPGGDDFLWPPHLMLYSGFLLAFIVGLWGLYALAKPNLAAGVRDPRQWVRRSPYLGALVLAAGYGLLSVPGDAIWHELYGVDLTAWSPPHIFLMLASASLPIFSAGLMLRSAVDTDSGRKPSSVPTWLGLAIISLIALTIAEVFLIATVEWELRVVTGFVAERPIWLYPVVTGVVAFFTLSLLQRLVNIRWAATLASLLYFGYRAIVTSTLLAFDGAPPRLTLFFVLGAILLDLSAQGRLGGALPIYARKAVAFTIGFVVVALPTIQFYYGQFLPEFGLMDHVLTVVVLLALCVVLEPLTRHLGDWMVSPAEPEEAGSSRSISAASAAD